MMTNIVKGFMILYKESPLDLRAVSSLFSEKLPKVIREEMSTDSGSASGIKLADT